MLPELSEIKRKRRALGLTQTGLSKSTGVSQSLIAKIEAGTMVPSYANAKKLFDFFESIHAETRLKASDIMTRKVISVSPNASVKSAVRLMEKSSVSQVPVLLEGKNTGTVSEKNVLERMNKAHDANEFIERQVEEIMEETMPQITEDTPLEVVSTMLAHNSGALVTRKGKITGIITKADLLKSAISGK